jgi:FtsZ-binding cell division protein ZapB
VAISEGSAEAKHAVFGRYKGRINNFLSQQGYDLKQEERGWQNRTKAAATREATTAPEFP